MDRERERVQKLFAYSDQITHIRAKRPGKLFKWFQHMGMIWRIQNPLDEKLCCTCQCLWLQRTFFPRTRFKNMGIKFKHAGMWSLQRGGLYLIVGVLLITISTLMWFISNWLMRNNLPWYFNGTFLTVTHRWHVLECLEHGCIFWSGSQHYASSEHFWQRWGKCFFYQEESLSRAQDFKALALLWMFGW